MRACGCSFCRAQNEDHQRSYGSVESTARMVPGASATGFGPGTAEFLICKALRSLYGASARRLRCTRAVIKLIALTTGPAFYPAKPDPESRWRGNRRRWYRARANWEPASLQREGGRARGTDGAPKARLPGDGRNGVLGAAICNAGERGRACRASLYAERDQRRASPATWLRGIRSRRGRCLRHHPDDAAVEKVVDDVAKRFGRLDILSRRGIQQLDPFPDLTSGRWRCGTRSSRSTPGRCDLTKAVAP